MPEHLIRLRGGWLQLDPHAEADGSGLRVTLPRTWPPRRIRLVRSFGPPPYDPPSETLSLRLAQVDGLVSARLNDREIARPTPGTSTLDIPLPGPLPRRNLLVLDVDPPVPGPGQAPAPWGEIALVISPAAPPTDDPGDLLGGNGPGD